MIKSFSHLTWGFSIRFSHELSDVFPMILNQMIFPMIVFQYYNGMFILNICMYYVLCILYVYGGVHKWRYPYNWCFVMENPIKMDENWGYPYDESSSLLLGAFSGRLEIHDFKWCGTILYHQICWWFIPPIVGDLGNGFSSFFCYHILLWFLQQNQIWMVKIRRSF